MKLELEKETRNIEQQDWYRILVDGRFIMGSYDYDKIVARYEEIKNNLDLLKNGTITLKSEEI